MELTGKHALAADEALRLCGPGSASINGQCNEIAGGQM